MMGKHGTIKQCHQFDESIAVALETYIDCLKRQTEEHEKRFPDPAASLIAATDYGMAMQAKADMANAQKLLDGIRRFWEHD